MLPTIGDKTATLLANFLPGFDPILKVVPNCGSGESTTSLDLLRDSTEHMRLDLPTAPGAEYSYTLWFDLYGERQISAQLTAHEDDRLSFWYRPFELAEFRDDLEKLETRFCEELEILLTHETRVIQRKGWLFWSFRCEYRKGEKWEEVYGYLALRWFKAPHIAGRRRIYYSAPISGVSSIG